MKFLNKYFRRILFLLILNLSIFIFLYLLKIPFLIALNKVIIFFGILELLILNLFSLTLFNQYLKYKKKIFGEILKFKISLYLLINIFGIFMIIVLTFSLLDYSPQINELYDQFNFQLEENYIKTLDMINSYKNQIQNYLNLNIDSTIFNLQNDPLTQLLLYKNKTYINKIESILFDELIKEEKVDLTLIEKDSKGFLIYKQNDLLIVYLIPDYIVKEKNFLFSLISMYKKIYGQKKNSPVVTLLALFLFIIPFMFFQIFFLFKYISKITKPLELLVSQFKNVSLNIYSQIPIPKKRLDEFSFIIIQFNRMQKQLEQRTLLLKYQERFEILAKISSKFAHEIKNPLTPIMLSCELIEKKYPYFDNFRDYLLTKIKVIKDNVESIRTSINRFYTISGKDSEKSISILINQFLKSIFNFWNSDSIEIKLEVPEKEYFLLAPKEDMESLFNNLIINSFEASTEAKKEKCNIFIKLIIEEDDKFCILYSDSGNGIKPEDINNIFEPYFTTKEHGSGFGLAISKSIVENINGSISFIGNGTLDPINYKGATFKITLPIHIDGDSNGK